MAVDVTCEVLIDRPRADVAAFMFDANNDAAWTSGLVEARPLSEGPLTEGSEVERVSKFLGRRFAYRIQVLSAEPDRYVEMLATQPFEMRVRYELEDGNDGKTVTRIRTSGGGTGFFRVAGPLLASMVKKSITKDLQQLRHAWKAS